MNNDVMMLVIAVVGLLTTFAITLYLVGYFRSTSEADNEHDRGGGAANARNLNRGGRRGLRNRRAGAAVLDENEELGGEEMEEGDAENDQDDDGPRAVGTSRKAMQKELKRQERERMRKFEDSRRQELKRRREAKEEAHRKRLEADELARGAHDEEEMGKRRSCHSVDTTDAATAENELLHEIAEYIEGQKVVVLEEVADDFGLRADVVTQCMEKLVASGRLSGILDDCGNFISISDDEMHAVASFIQDKGRVTLHELGVEGPRLIGLP